MTRDKDTRRDASGSVDLFFTFSCISSRSCFLLSFFFFLYTMYLRDVSKIRSKEARRSADFKVKLNSHTMFAKLSGEIIKYCFRSKFPEDIGKNILEIPSLVSRTKFQGDN